jgi:polar amino acid transport system substrate-binding protein
VLYVVNEQQMAIAMQKNRPELLKTMNAFIAANIANGKLNAAFQKWLGTPLPSSVVNAGK